ncbi:MULTISPECIES: hypothetical protein [Sphingomonas]|jgi:hypothetical protein|uniref:hypothetical protein n=1 Tax=Sphingomonas TaxID=13687 RepID=UPI0006212F03|nr:MULTISPECIES: hypothetical protein [Sphingomonas]KKI19501.1 hypothetical protein XM50_08195 [Sphingomonas sp. Ag1]MDF2604056.1 hypothetical protein [Sphingomonas sp.]
MTAAEKIQLFSALAPVIATVGVAAMLGWVATTWMRIRNGYPLDGQWGQALYPKRDDETIERVKLLTQENGQLRAELGSMKDRLQNVERIVTDSGHLLSQEIEQLRDRAN